MSFLMLSVPPKHKTLSGVVIFTTPPLGKLCTLGEQITQSSKLFKVCCSVMLNAYKTNLHHKTVSDDMSFQLIEKTNWFLSASVPVQSILGDGRQFYGPTRSIDEWIKALIIFLSSWFSFICLEAELMSDSSLLSAVIVCIWSFVAMHLPITTSHQYAGTNMLRRFFEMLSDLICLDAAVFSCSANLSINNSAYQFKRTNVALPASPAMVGIRMLF